MYGTMSHFEFLVNKKIHQYTTTEKMLQMKKVTIILYHTKPYLDPVNLEGLPNTTDLVGIVYCT